jgi:hypothetical protein
VDDHASEGASMRTRIAPLLLLLPMLSACGQASDIAVESTVDRPYDGPMHVKPDYSDRATAQERSGAAGRALECDGEPYDGGSGDYFDGGLVTVQPDAREALEDHQDQAGLLTVPRDGFVVERVDDGRVLFSYDVGEKTKVAYIAADDIRDYNDEVGWGIESWASCDPAEFPAAVNKKLGIRVWHDQQGDQVPVSTITHDPGPEHCNWQDITFLSMGEVRGGQEYLADRKGEFTGHGVLTTTYDGDAVLPHDATDTGYEYDNWHLWLAADRGAAYVVDVDDPSQVERWPAANDQIGCM